MKSVGFCRALGPHAPRDLSTDCCAGGQGQGTLLAIFLVVPVCPCWFTLQSYQPWTSTARLVHCVSLGLPTFSGLTLYE